MGPDVNIDVIKTNTMRGKFFLILLSWVNRSIDLSYPNCMKNDNKYKIRMSYPFPAIQGLTCVLQSLLNWRSQRMRLTCVGLVVTVLVIYNQRW